MLYWFDWAVESQSVLSGLNRVDILSGIKICNYSTVVTNVNQTKSGCGSVSPSRPVI